MRKKTIACILAAVPLLAAIASSQEPSSNDRPNDSKAAVEQVLRTQQNAWNRHDLDGFMAGYWNSAELTFFSGAKQTSGWQATLDRYRAKYAGPGNEMGKLDFSDLRVEILGPDAAF